MKLKQKTLKELKSFAVKHANKIPKDDLCELYDDWDFVKVGAEEWRLNFHMVGAPNFLYVEAYPVVVDGKGRYVTTNMEKNAKVITFRILKKDKKLVPVTSKKTNNGGGKR